MAAKGLLNCALYGDPKVAHSKDGLSHLEVIALLSQMHRSRASCHGIHSLQAIVL